jgi:archaellum biogenesis ATPase FlaH
MNKKRRVKDARSLWALDADSMPAYIAAGILPIGGVLLFGGPTGVGKSLMALNMIHDLLHRERSEFLGTPGYTLEKKPSRIIYVDAEVGEYGMAERLKEVFPRQPAAGELLYTDQVSDLLIDEDIGRRRLLNMVEMEKPDIVILDPVSNLMEGDDSSNKDVKGFYQGLNWVKEKYGHPLTYLLVHHFRKEPAGRYSEDYDPLDPQNFRGASTWVGQAWTAMTMAGNRIGDLARRASWPKIRHGPPDSKTYQLKWEGRRVTAQGRVKKPGGFASPI